jgi:DNA end-binding protein Ku
VRPYWKGYLKLALVSCPIALHTARSTAERITFRHLLKNAVSLDGGAISSP